MAVWLPASKLYLQNLCDPGIFDKARCEYSGASIFGAGNYNAEEKLFGGLVFC
jgi:hypothetical protein